MTRPVAVALYVFAALLPLPFVARDVAAESVPAAVIVVALIVGVGRLALPLVGLWLGSRIAWLMLLTLDVLTLVSSALLDDWANVVLALLRVALLLSAPVRIWVFR